MSLNIEDIKSKVEKGLPLSKEENIKYLMEVHGCTYEKALMIVEKGYEDCKDI